MSRVPSPKRIAECALAVAAVAVAPEAAVIAATVALIFKHRVRIAGWSRSLKDKIVDFVGRCKLFISGSGAIGRWEYDKLLVLCQNIKTEAKSENKGVPCDLIASLDQLAEENKDLRKENYELKAQLADQNVTINNMKDAMNEMKDELAKLQRDLALNNALMLQMMFAHGGAPQPQPATSDIFSQIQGTLQHPPTGEPSESAPLGFDDRLTGASSEAK
ncbi:MAG: hypothetical protein J3Q66DRAFT_198450 [Benniella sp.]|nr:MAG: hypothetical protein J3Q66DRAFT_198450 [Benniella sp.]